MAKSKRKTVSFIAKKKVSKLVKCVIAKQKRGINIDDIYASQPLRTRTSASPPGLGFNSVGLRALTVKLNSAFSEFELNLAFDDVCQANIKTVRDLYLMVWDKIPEQYKEQSGGHREK